MYKIKKQILFLAIIYSFTNLAGYNPYYDSLSKEEISDNIKQEIIEFATINQIPKLPEFIRKVTPKVVYAYPALKYGGQLDSYLYINESVFITLNSDEKKYLLGWLFLSKQPKEQVTINLSKNFGLALGSQILLSQGLFYISKKYKLNQIQRIPLFLIFSTPYLYFIKFKHPKELKNINLSVDKILIKQLNCADGGLTYWKKIKELDPEFCTKYIENVDNRIANLAKLTT